MRLRSKEFKHYYISKKGGIYLELSNRLVCPSCGGRKFTAKYEASYLYSYVVDSDAPGLKNDKEFLPFLFENREQMDAGSILSVITAEKSILVHLAQAARRLSLQYFRRQSGPTT
jgi:hypothetical protein